MKKFILGVLVSNHFGVLSRVTALFSRRGFNIDSLTVGETECSDFSRITVTMTGDEYQHEQIIKQLNKLHDVKIVQDLETEDTVIREIMLVKVRVSAETRSQIMDAVNVFRSKIVDFGTDSLCVEVTGESSKLDAFIDYVRPFGIIEMCRTGAIALCRGKESLN